MTRFLCPSGTAVRHGASLAVVTLVALATLAVAADFGAPAWFSFLALSWCGTLGLPTTLAALSVASFWGRFEPCFGFAPFLATATALSLVAQVAAAEILERGFRSPQP